MMPIFRVEKYGASGWWAQLLCYTLCLDPFTYPMFNLVGKKHSKYKIKCENNVETNVEQRRDNKKGWTN
jgi:hypothetical protein